MSKVRLPYPAEISQRIVELVRAGRTPAELSHEFCVTAQCITDWVGQATIDSGKTASLCQSKISIAFP